MSLWLWLQLVVIVTEFQPGGRLIDHVDSARAAGFKGEQLRLRAMAPADTAAAARAAGTVTHDDGASSVASERAAAHRDLLAAEFVNTVPVEARTETRAEQLQEWTRQVAAGLRALHAAGCTHRNLNPGNVYLDERRRAVVGGFQCLKSPRAPGCPTSFGRADCGSAAVIAPEVEDGGRVSPKADVWALGCCVFRWITGELPPMRHLPIDAALRRVPHGYGEKLKRVLRMALEPHPRARASAEDIWVLLSGSDRKHGAR